MAKKKTRSVVKNNRTSKVTWPAKFAVSSNGGTAHSVRCTVSLTGDDAVERDEVLDRCCASALSCRIKLEPIQSNLPSMEVRKMDYEFQATCKSVAIGGKTAAFTLHSDGKIDEYESLAEAHKKEGKVTLQRLGDLDAGGDSTADDQANQDAVT